jgi:formylglycine-generating enzyme required for sulfatase activity
MLRSGRQGFFSLLESRESPASTPEESVIRYAQKGVGVCALIALLVAQPARAVLIDWVTIGDPGNFPDTAPFSHYGGVPYTYQIDKYDVTYAQYAEFLNAKDPTGANALGIYHIGMSQDANVAGIAFNSGAAPGSKYSVMAGQANKPVAYVSFYSALRFANWLNNGQGSGDTESGAYTLLGGTPTPSNGTTITRNPGATVFLPSEDEWYKAAYYKGGGTNAGYWLYATQSDALPASVPPGPNVANGANYIPNGGTYAVTGSSAYDPNQNYLTDVGAYGESAGPYRTFDQNGDLYQWTEAPDASFRAVRGGSWGDNEDPLRSSTAFSSAPQFGENFNGFRVASIPEPAGLTAPLLGAIALRRRRRNRFSLRHQSFAATRWGEQFPQKDKGPMTTDRHHLPFGAMNRK